MRGNHEFAISNRFFRQRHRERNEAHLGITTFLDELEEAFPGYTYPDLLYWYDYLPVFVTLGSVDKKGKKRFLGCSHAGLELGWSAARFLENDALSFAYPTIIDRSLILADLEKIYGNDFLVEYNQMVALLVQDESSHRFLALYKEPERLFLAQKQLSPFEYRLGWIWNNLIAEDNKQQFIAASGSRRALFLGQELINYLFKKYSTDNAELIALVRGHQHFNEELPELGLKNNYLELIRDNKGLIRQWGGRAYTLGATTTVSHCYSFLTVTPQQDSSWGAVAWHKELLSDSWQERVYSLRDA